MARKWLPENVTAYKDRHGKTRYRYRKAGQPTYSFKSAPGMPEFLVELANAQAGTIEATPAYAPFSYDELIVSYYRTTRWVEMADNSKRTYRGIIERFRAKNGDKDARHTLTSTIDHKLTAMAKTPAAANNLRKVLSRLHRHAIKLGWRTDNPVAATDPYKQGKGFHSWSEVEIDAFEAQWPVGTKERLAFALLLYTGLRMSDMLRLGPQHVRDGKLILHHTKNDADVVLPIIAPLREALDAMDGQHLVYLVTEHGKPYTAKGFGNWFRRKCDKAGLPQCSAHGLRKAMARRLAESGATNLQGRAVTGHKSDRMFNYYAAQANQADMADVAMANLAVKVSQKGKKDV